ncbi:ThiF family adenylyltransferase, partial [Actinotalea ferrariae]|uniref:ThiF family adenylyltransferase n=1 Tax=Actinotalea ferrariae TaxID=1386098 RepID=UPI001C8C6427
MGGRAGRTPEEEPRLRGRLPVLWRSATEVQVGTDPRWSVALSDLTPGAVRALGGVPASAERRTLVAAMRRAGCAEAEVRSVLAHLAAAHLLVPPVHPDASGDEGAWALVDGRGDGGSTSARRAGGSVAVHGLGRTGTAIAATLAAAGVGTVVLVDDGSVTRHDVGVGGLRVEDVGLARTAAVGRLLLGVAPGVRTIATGHADLTVLVEHHAADPVRYSALHDAGRAHLSVVVREASVLVGPLVRPGATACLRCVDLARSRRDDRWPAVAAQLAR